MSGVYLTGVRSNQPRCHCGGEMKRNGTTSKGTTRWRCKQCGASSVKRRNDITN
ncbi:transposase-like zinc-binding domain-containing protein, partial [Corynebacterium hiratae]|uniref:transposase-like zinc-binding domain-containing protein n=1 Tax=Corynebacterium hiratae TaxID=3139423 RepID=UPI003F6DF0A4